MRRLVIATTVVSCFLVIALPRAADACSIVNDIVSPPETQRPFDENESPAAPFVTAARIVHHHDDAGCNDGASCGDFHGLRMTLEVDPATTVIRIDFDNSETVYAGLWDVRDGTAEVFIPGYGNDDVLNMNIRALDDRGYVSEGVAGQVINEGHGDGGCRATGRHQSGVLLLLALMFAVVRRRRTDGAVGRGR